MMNPILAEILKTRMVKSPTGELIPVTDGIATEEGLTLQEIIAEIKAVKTLEVGLRHGVSALFICDALKDVPAAHHIVIDPNQLRDVQGIGLQNLKNAGYIDLLEPHIASSHIVLPQLEEQGRKIDFAFIDASHLFDYTLLEFFYIDRILRIGGVIAFDDASMPGVIKVLRFIVRNRRYTVFRSIPNVMEAKKLNKYRLAKAVLHSLSKLKKIIKPEYLAPDIDYGVVPGARFIAVRKEADDTEHNRPWDAYSDF